MLEDWCSKTVYEGVVTMTSILSTEVCSHSVSLMSSVLFSTTVCYTCKNTCRHTSTITQNEICKIM